MEGALPLCQSVLYLSAGRPAALMHCPCSSSGSIYTFAIYGSLGHSTGQLGEVEGRREAGYWQRGPVHSLSSNRGYVF